MSNEQPKPYEPSGDEIKKAKEIMDVSPESVREASEIREAWLEVEEKLGKINKIHLINDRKVTATIGGKRIDLYDGPEYAEGRIDGYQLSEDEAGKMIKKIFYLNSLNKVTKNAKFDLQQEHNEIVNNKPSIKTFIKILTE